MFEVSVSGQFSAAHQLRRPDGSWEPRHEHDWQVQVTYCGPELDETGVLLDFGPIRARLQAVLAELRATNLNELPAFAGRSPSAELVAVYIAERLTAELPDAGGLCCVEVEEEAGCRARYFPARSR